LPESGRELAIQMVIPPRSRFYAMIYAQLMGGLIVLSGAAFYWIQYGNTAITPRIGWRILTLAGLCFAMALIPSAWNQAIMIIKGLAGRDRSVEDDSEPLANNASFVRGIVWIYCWADLLFLTYLVHITGGLSGSMYGGLYLLIPAMALILIHNNNADVKIALWLIASVIIGILLSYLMSRNQWYEFKAAQPQYESAFNVSLALVTGESITIPILQIAVLWFQREETEKKS
jgi:hypothetical protein